MFLLICCVYIDRMPWYCWDTQRSVWTRTKEWKMEIRKENKNWRTLSYEGGVFEYLLWRRLKRVAMAVLVAIAKTIIMDVRTACGDRRVDLHTKKKTNFCGAILGYSIAPKLFLSVFFFLLSFLFHIIFFHFSWVYSVQCTVYNSPLVYGACTHDRIYFSGKIFFSFHGGLLGLSSGYIL